MAVTITYADVILGFETDIPEAQVDLLIAIIDEADTCLDAYAVSASAQEILKLSAVRHMLTLMSSAGSGKGAVTSESAPSGASRSYRPAQAGDLSATSYGALIKQLDKFGCITARLENNQYTMLRSIGRRAPSSLVPTVNL